MNVNKLEKWIWVLIYGGLLLLIFGLAVEPRDALIGRILEFTGGASAGLGVVLILVRSVMKAPG